MYVCVCEYVYVGGLYVCILCGMGTHVCVVCACRRDAVGIAFWTKTRKKMGSNPLYTSSPLS